MARETQVRDKSNATEDRAKQSQSKGSSSGNPKEIAIPDSISVRELAELMDISLIDVIKHLMGEGIMANINQQLDGDIARMVAEDMGFTIKEKVEPEIEVPEEVVEAKPTREYTEEERARLQDRPPVITVMGHVDHGKTALLDIIREANVAAGEAGGITQRIGAYQIQKQDRRITFLDTPGHEAFTAMRARGAQATDIAILVVAADDGVMPQTLEAIDHAKAAQVPIIVAINKIDKANANPEMVKQQLADVDLLVEDWGGDVIAVEVSALRNMNIDELLDMILLVSDMAEFKALPDVPAKGTVIDAHIDRSMGPLATILVQEGTLRVGDSLVAGTIPGKVRAMFDDKMERIEEAGPSMPAVVMGLSDIPEPGDTSQVVEDDKTARSIAEDRAEAQEEQITAAPAAQSLEEIYAQIQAGEAKELNLILKTEIQGSIEPIVNSIEELGGEEATVNILHASTGTIGENDVMLATASNAVIIGFDVEVAPTAAKLAETEGINIRLYNIIYKLIEDVDRALRGMLEPEYREVVLGHARVLTTFNIPRQGVVAGAQVTDGRATRNASVRVLRNGRMILEGDIRSLKRYTEDVREVSVGMEFGIGIEGFSDYADDDLLEFYTEEEVEPLEDF
jgi:translation initiation factor IF-2